MTNEQIIEEIAARNNAVVLYYKGGIAIQHRWYDDEGKQIIRYRPEPWRFIPAETWVALDEDGAADCFIV